MHSRPEFVPKLLPGEVQESPKRVPGGSPESPGTLPGGSRGSPGGVSSQVNEKDAAVLRTTGPFGHGNVCQHECTVERIVHGCPACATYV